VEASKTSTLPEKSTNIDIADLDKLNLHAGPMKIRAVVDADIPSQSGLSETEYSIS
jgi:hypothetical protein